MSRRRLLTTPLTPEFSARMPAPLDIPFNELPKPTRDPDQLRRDLYRSGFCYIQDALSSAELATLRQRLAEQMEAEVEAGISSHDGGPEGSEVGNNVWKDAKRGAAQPNQKVLMLVNKGQCFRDLVTEKAVAEDLVDELLGKKWLLSSLWANIARPGGRPMAMHCDQGGAMPRYFSREAAMRGGSTTGSGDGDGGGGGGGSGSKLTTSGGTPGHPGQVPAGFRGSDAYDHSAQSQWDAARVGPDGKFTTESLLACVNEMEFPDLLMPPVYCQVVYFLTDVTPENGGTCCVPGSHLAGMLPPLDVDFTLKFPTANFSAKAGTAVVFDGRLWHATGANVTASEARPMIFQYCNCPNFRQQENMHVGVLPEVLAAASPKLRERLGYKVWGPYNFTELLSKTTRWIGPGQPRYGEMRPATTGSSRAAGRGGSWEGGGGGGTGEPASMRSKL